MLLDYLHLHYPILPYIFAQLEAIACAWIVVSIIRFTPSPESKYRIGKSACASILLACASIELVRGLFGLTTGVSPYLVAILFIFAWRLHKAKGNIGRLNYV
jgi:hypothetical protein